MSSKESAGSSSPSSSAKAASATENAPITSIKLSREPGETLPVYTGEIEKLTATVTPEASAGKVVWSSSDPTIATVDQNGNVKGVKKGNCTITASGGSASASAGIWVSPEFEYICGGDGVSESGNMVTIQYSKVNSKANTNGALRLFRYVKTNLYTSDPTIDYFTCKEVGNDTTYKLSNSSVIKMITSESRDYYFLVLGRGTVNVTMSCPGSSSSLTVTVNVV